MERNLVVRQNKDNFLSKYFDLKKKRGKGGISLDQIFQYFNFSYDVSMWAYGDGHINIFSKAFLVESGKERLVA